jgi:anion transporter
VAREDAAKATGYDKYINYRTFSIAVGAFVLILVLPTCDSMVDVAVEYTAGESQVLDFYAEELFGRSYHESEQWQAMTARVLESNMRQGALSRRAALARDAKQIGRLGMDAPEAHVARYQSLVRGIDDEAFLDLMTRAQRLRYTELSLADLSPQRQERAREAAFHLKVCLALTAFVVICFLTEALPLPGVAFCIGLILVLFGVVSYQDIAQLFWSDACWFIMGSLMFAAAFIKTGVDRRICLALFSRLAKPRITLITGIMILVIAPAASFISDHALAAIFLPVAMILYSNSLTARVARDTELAKMLVICVAMACNIGGFGSPSGGARNVILMNYMEDMFDISIGYGQWILYGMPFVIVMMPVLWILLNVRFKPKIKDLGPALAALKEDIVQMGGWNRKQVAAVVIFLLMFLGWVTDKTLIRALLGFPLGIGTIAVMGAVAYLLLGVVNWRDYQDKVDWGVVWLYAGAIVFGRVLDSSGAAYWMARSLVEGLAQLGMSSNAALLGVGGCVTAGLTNLMADGPAAAAVGPITLNMAAVAGSGTTLVPFMGLVTACASSFAYLLVIGTPPNAIVYASGHLTPRDYLRVGIPCFVVAMIVMLLMSLLYWPLLGFPGLKPM